LENKIQVDQGTRWAPRELADQTAKEAAINSDINECYTRIPMSIVRRELRDYSATKWQSEQDITTKGAITKNCFPKKSRQVKT